MKVTLIQKLQHEVLLMTPTGKIKFDSVEAAVKYAKDKDLTIEIRHIHPGGINGNRLPDSHKNIS